MTPPLWQILIASVYTRHTQLETLLDTIAPQLRPYDGRAQVLVNRDDHQQPVGAKRDRLLNAATATYTCFIDDDDHVATNYAARIMGALADRPDYVGFRVELTVDGRADPKPVIHSLEHKGWSHDANGYYRGISHLNPVRRDAALTGLPFLDGFGEDKAWSVKLAASGLVQSQVMLDGDPLYFYDYSSAGSLFTGAARPTGQPSPAAVAHTHVQYLDENTDR